MNVAAAAEETLDFKNFEMPKTPRLLPCDDPVGSTDAFYGLRKSDADVWGEEFKENCVRMLLHAKA